MRRLGLLDIPYKSHRWPLAQLGHQCNLRQQSTLETVVNMLASVAIYMRCARSPIGDNIALGLLCSVA